MDNFFYTGQTPELTPDPNDKRKDEDRIRDGMWNMVSAILAIWIAIIICALCCGCTTHKTLSHVTNAIIDTTHIVNTDSMHLSNQSTDSISFMTHDSIHSTMHDQVDATHAETITEHIEERFTPDGTRVVTTDRTINSQGTFSKLSDSETYANRFDSYVNVAMQRMDSMYTSMESSMQAHAERNDSMMQQSERSAQGVVAISKHFTIVFVVLMFLIVISIAIIAFFQKKRK